MRSSISNPTRLRRRNSSTTEASKTINANSVPVELLCRVAPLEKPVCARSISPEVLLMSVFLCYAKSRPLDNQKVSSLQWRPLLLVFDEKNREHFLFESFLTCFKHTFMFRTCQGWNDIRKGFLPSMSPSDGQNTIKRVSFR